MDKYAVCVRKKTSIVGDLPLGKNGKFAKIIFYFLRADQDAECHKLQSCHNWQRSKSWWWGRNVSSLQFEDLRLKKKMVEILCKNIQCSSKEGK